MEERGGFEMGERQLDMEERGRFEVGKRQLDMVERGGFGVGEKAVVGSNNNLITLTGAQYWLEHISSPDRPHKNETINLSQKRSVFGIV
jgi:hypothetical protein